MLVLPILLIILLSLQERAPKIIYASYYTKYTGMVPNPDFSTAIYIVDTPAPTKITSKSWSHHCTASILILTMHQYLKYDRGAVQGEIFYCSRLLYELPT